jgi:hypothetical protein
LDKYLKALDCNAFWSQAHTKRYHSEATSRNQNLSEHSHRVAFLAVKLLYESFDYMGGMPSVIHAERTELAIHRYAMIHDIVETQGGSDLASHVKAHLRSNGVDVNPIMHNFFWDQYGHTNEGDYNIDRSAKIFVSLADTIEGKIFAYTIPAGGVRDQVIRDWEKIFEAKLNKYLEEFDSDFLYGVVKAKYFNNNAGVDPAWI